MWHSFFSTKLPGRLGVKQPRAMLHLSTICAKTINMSIGGQHIGVIDVSGGWSALYFFGRDDEDDLLHLVK
jgi:hypothetical protein